MPAWVMLWSCVCLSVCPSVTSRYSVETAGRIVLFFIREAILGLHDMLLQRNSDISKMVSVAIVVWRMHLHYVEK